MKIEEDLLLRSAVSQGLITLEELEGLVSSRPEESNWDSLKESLIQSRKVDEESLANFHQKAIEDL